MRYLVEFLVSFLIVMLVGVGVYLWLDNEQLKAEQDAVRIAKEKKQAELQRLKDLPATHWMVVDDIFVFDGTLTALPKVIYDRTINIEFVGNWSVNLQLVNGNTITDICHGSGTSSYLPESDPTKDGARTVTFNWFSGFTEHCKPVPGRYRFQVYWILNVGKDITKRKSKLSNIFTLTE